MIKMFDEHDAMYTERVGCNIDIHNSLYHSKKINYFLREYTFNTYDHRTITITDTCKVLDEPTSYNTPNTNKSHTLY